MARNNVAGVEPGGHGQRVPHVVRGQVAQRRLPGEFDHGHTRGGVVAKVPGLVTDLGLDAAADCAALALAVGGEAEDADVTRAYRQALE